MTNDFSTLGLRPELLAALEQLEYREMTPIQAAALPPVLRGEDVTGQAKTGSGKTAAFGLGLLQRLQPGIRGVQALVLCPTRELAEQVAAALRALAQRSSNTHITVVCGGRSFRDQRVAIEAGAGVVVGTPGRIVDHLEKGTLSLDGLGMLVLDEADRMLDMGFVDQVRSVLAACPTERQTLLFSATFSPEIRALSAELQRSPTEVSVASTVDPGLLRQWVFEAEPGQRNELVAKLLATHRPDSALVFCETRGDCDTVARFLTHRGTRALALHGGLEQEKRDDVLVQFSNGSAPILVATNVAARGLDIPALPCVIVSELSPDPESHLHRIGRTGRAGEPGLALSVVVGPVEHGRLQKIEEFLGHPLEWGPPPTEGSGLAFMAPKNRTVLILSGRKSKLRKGDVMGALVKDGKIPADAIGQIDLSPKTCAVAIEQAHARAALKFLQRARVKKLRLRAVLLGDDAR